MTAAVVSVDGVEKTYGRGVAAVHALRGVSLDVHPGELLILAGPSGSGKSTLISIMSGVLDADVGRASVLGVDWSTLNADARARRRSQLVGFVFQQFNLVPTLRAEENVAVPLLIRGQKRRAALKAARQRLSAVGLGERVSATPRELSGGMQQRVAIARALATDPPVLICDEPSANLDGETARSIMDLLRRSAAATTTEAQRCVVVVTHDSRLFEYADRLVQLVDGRLVDSDDATQASVGGEQEHSS